MYINELYDDETNHELTESKQFRTKKSLNKYHGKTITDSIFLYFLALTILKKEEGYEKKASKYAGKVLRMGHFVRFKVNAPDLYILLYALYNPSDVNFKNNTDKEYLNDIQLSKTYVREWLRFVKMGKNYSGYDRKFLIKSSSSFNILHPDYKSMRILVQNWEEQSEYRKSLVVTMLLRSLRQKIPKSDILGDIKKLGKKKKYDLDELKKQQQQQKKQSYGKKKRYGTYGALGFVGGIAAQSMFGKKK